MKKIVTIDFDIIMGPSIEVYNHFIPYEKTWDELMLNPQIALSTGDYVHYQRILIWLLKMAKEMPKENFHFIGEHHSILKFLDENEQYDIVNIDHHHDCGYADDEGIYKTMDIDCTNWVAKAYDKGLVKRYTWLHNADSTLYSPTAKRIIDFKFDLKNYNLDMLPTPDEIYICFSEIWIPPTLRPLFYIWLDTFNIFYNTRFEVE